MDVVDIWTGGRANALQQALRLTNEAFAERLGTAVRTVAKWSAQPTMEPQGEIQQALDTMLDQAPSSAKARFALLLARSAEAEAELATSSNRESESNAAAELRLASDPHIGAALAWLDQHSEWPPGTSRRKAASRLAAIDVRALQDRGYRRGNVEQAQIARALSDYYTPDDGVHGTYRASCDGTRFVETSILTKPSWLDLACKLTGETDQIVLSSAVADTGGTLDRAVAEAAIQRLAESVAVDARIVDSPLYRLIDIDVTPGRLGGKFGLTTFVQYAVTMDLLEGEVVDALSEGKAVNSGSLPLRDHLMADMRSVLDTRDRICSGGALALCAIARPSGRSRRSAPDYVLLVQERSGRVLNASRRLAVIPKCFHEPIVDYDDDTQIGSTLRREMEEELFGREDVDGTISAARHADPMHPSRLSDPMRWLMSNEDSWNLECTGFGLNLVSGNFEFASLIVIHDEEFWINYGGHIVTNWESDGLRQYSSLDRGRLIELIADPAWSNEGVFALLQGLRRLSEIGSTRVDLPTIEWEIH